MDPPSSLLRSAGRPAAGTQPAGVLFLTPLQTPPAGGGGGSRGGGLIGGMLGVEQSDVSQISLSSNSSSPPKAALGLRLLLPVVLPPSLQPLTSSGGLRSGADGEGGRRRRPKRNSVEALDWSSRTSKGNWTCSSTLTKGWSRRPKRWFVSSSSSKVEASHLWCRITGNRRSKLGTRHSSAEVKPSGGRLGGAGGGGLRSSAAEREGGRGGALSLGRRAEARCSRRSS